MKTTRVRQRGFTLIELLVVVAIIVLLASLTAGTYFRVYAGEKVRATNATAVKLNTGVDRAWSAILDAAAEDASKGAIHPAVMTLAGNDKDRARSMWTILKLKNELPTTFAEAHGELCPNPTQYAAGTSPRGIWVWSPQNNAVPAVLVLKPKAIFSQLPLTTSATPEEQSAVCLHLALTAAGRRGETAEGDGYPTRDGLIGGVTMRFFHDSWDTPIAFSRMTYTAEVNTPEYFRAGSTSRDPCDPNGRLVIASGGWTNPTSPSPYSPSNNSLNDFWARATADHMLYAGFPRAVPLGSGYPFPTTLNWVATVISAGPNKQFLDNGGSNLFAADSDNIVGYRVRREGNRGD